MNWISVNEALPPLAKRVLTKTSTGHITFGKMVRQSRDTFHWVDDQTMPMRSVAAWCDLVAQDETA